MATIRETSQRENKPESHGTMDCEQGCLASADECEDIPESNEEACSSDFLTCVNNCQTLLSPVS